MEEKLTQELIDMILDLSMHNYNRFLDNYSLKGNVDLLQFINDLEDVEDIQEVINEIHINKE